jgi:hypothetical protein
MIITLAFDTRNYKMFLKTNNFFLDFWNGLAFEVVPTHEDVATEREAEEDNRATSIPLLSQLLEVVARPFADLDAVERGHAQEISVEKNQSSGANYTTF